MNKRFLIPALVLISLSASAQVSNPPRHLLVNNR
jgi:hypothetical protein